MQYPGGPLFHEIRPRAPAPAGSRSDKRPRHAGSIVDRGTPVNRLFHQPGFAGACRTMGERSSCEQREWHSLLFLRNPAALRDGRATHRRGVGFPTCASGGPAACAAPAGSRSDKRPRHAGSILNRGTPVNRLFHQSRFAGVCRTMAERSSCEQREWHGLLFPRNPAALRDGRATRRRGTRKIPEDSDT